MLDFAMKVAERSHEVDDADFAALRDHGFSDEDIWDIGAIAAFFALSNRMANLMAMRPNDEFYTMGQGRDDEADRAAARRAGPRGRPFATGAGGGAGRQVRLEAARRSR